jgi:hypothetical protein
MDEELKKRVLILEQQQKTILYELEVLKNGTACKHAWDWKEKYWDYKCVKCGVLAEAQKR